LSKSHASKKPYACVVCQKAFKERLLMLQHKKGHGQKPFKCNVCDKRFNLSGHLAEHTRIHTGERPYKCELCPSTFRVKTILREHMMRHNADEKKLEVEEEESSLKVDANVQEKKKGTEPNSVLEKIVVALEIDKAQDLIGALDEFARHESLALETDVKKNLKANVCLVCELAFPNRRALELHMKTSHASELPYKCDQCQKVLNAKGIYIYT